MKVLRVLSAMVLCVTLMACAHNSPPLPGSIKTILLYPPIPYEYLNCHNEPLVPEIRSQEDFAVWVEQVRQAGDDCRDNLAGLRAFILSWEADVDMMDPWWDEGDDY